MFNVHSGEMNPEKEAFMAKRKILVVDDEQDSLEFTKGILQEEGHRVITASDGDEGLQKTLDEKPNLVILDIVMPKRNGLSVFYEMQRNPSSWDIPVVMLTGVGEKIGIEFSAEDIKKFMGMQPKAYIEKPIEPEELKKIVEKIFKEKV